MASNNCYEKPYLTNRRSMNDETYVLIVFKSDNTFIIKKKSNVHGVDENGIVNIKDRGQTYTGYCLFEGTKDEIEAAAERVDKEMNRDLESDCETVIGNSKVKPPRQNSTTKTTTNSSNSNTETVGPMSTKATSTQKKSDHAAQQKRIQSLASANFDLSLASYKTPPPTNVSIQTTRVRDTFGEQNADINGNALRSIENVAKNKKNGRVRERILTFDDASSEDKSDDDDDDDDDCEELIEQVDDLEDSSPVTLITNSRHDDVRPSKRSFSKTSKRTLVEKSAKRSCNNLSSSQEPSNKDGKHLLKKLLLSIDYLNKDSYRSSKDVKSLVVSIERIDKKLNILYENQKKMQRALSKKKINVALNGAQFGDENMVADESPFKSTLIYIDSKGQSIDLLQLYGAQTHMGRYVALVMDNIFTKEEITTTSLADLLKDERYSIIKEAVRSRFKLNHELLRHEWPTLHECILQKRRNEIKKKKNGLTNETTVTVRQSGID